MKTRTQAGGTINDKDYKKFIREFKRYDFDSLNFSKKSCCDSSIKTLLIYYNGKFKRLKSMNPPKEVMPFIAFLINLSIKISLPKYQKAIDFEE